MQPNLEAPASPTTRPFQTLSESRQENEMGSWNGHQVRRCCHYSPKMARAAQMTLFTLSALSLFTALFGAIWKDSMNEEQRNAFTLAVGTGWMSGASGSIFNLLIHEIVYRPQHPDSTFNITFGPTHRNSNC